MDSSVADELAEPGILADRVEVRVVPREVAEEVGALDGLAEVLERLGPTAGEALDAGEVVGEERVLGILRDEPAFRELVGD